MLARASGEDVSGAAFPFLHAREMEVGLVPALVCRITYTGDLGYEIYVEPQHQVALYQALATAGADLGMTPFSMRAMMSLRIEKSFGGWPRSYPYWGGDAMAYAGSGFIWDNALAQGKTLRVYGEFVKATVRWKDRSRKGRPSFMQCWRDYCDGTGKIEIRATAAIKTLEPYICPTAIGFPGIVSDSIGPISSSTS